MISWKHSFQKLSEEYEMAKKKKQALDNLLSSGRISQSTFEVFNDEIHDGMLDIERQQHLLQEKMNAKVAEITEQIRSLEMLLANFEIQHVAGEIDEEAYRRQIDLLTIGLDSFRIELDAIKEAANQLDDSAVASPGEGFAIDSKNEVSRTEVNVVEIPVVQLREKTAEGNGETTQATAEKPVEEQQQS